MKTCTLCPAVHYGRGFCKRHYGQWLYKNNAEFRQRKNQYVRIYEKAHRFCIRLTPSHFKRFLDRCKKRRIPESELSWVKGIYARTHARAVV